MSADRDPTRIVRSWLEEGVTTLPDRVLDAVLDELPATPQRRAFWWPARRLFEMNKALSLGIAGAAVVIVALLGITLFGGGGVNIGGPEPTPAPTPTPAALPSPGSLAPGTYLVDEPDWAPAPYTFTVPAGWTVDRSGFVEKHAGGNGEVGFTTWILTHIFSDACDDSEANLVDVGTTAEELASALLVQQSRVASQTAAVIDGYPAIRVELSFPTDLDLATCDGRAWPDPGPDMNGGQLVRDGQTQVIYAINVDGERFVLVASLMPGTSAEDLAELQAVIDSVRIDPGT